MAVKIQPGGAAATLSLTPLIDVVFLLLIFFLVTSEFEDEERRLDIVLPSATSAKPMIAKVREIVVDIDRGGGVFLAGQKTSIETLEDLLSRAVADNPSSQEVIIRADRGVAFQPVVDVMDVCNRTGVEKYSVTTDDGPAS